MKWKSIRLELAPVTGFPDGSASRAYLIRLPLDDTGKIDETEVEGRPHQATVRRFWPCQPDLSGHLVRSDSGWAFNSDRGSVGRPLFHLNGKPLKLGDQVLVMEPDGTALPFRVASLRALA